MAVMNKKTNGGTKAKKDVEAMKKASEELLGMGKGQKYGAEAMPNEKKKMAIDAMKKTPGAISEGEKEYAKTVKKKKKTNGY